MSDIKLKVLIADDEHKIGMLVKTLIEWDELNLEYIDIVNDGEKAFEAICDKQPDIVITDIQMPRMNGLDLIAATKEKYQNIHFIVISGYKDFKYAHKALQYGVKYYLLKPVNAMELNNNLKELCIEFSEETTKKKEEEIFQKEKLVSNQIIKKNALNHMVEQEGHAALDVLAQVNLSADMFWGLDIKLDYREFEKNDTNQDHITVNRIFSIMESTCKETASECLMCDMPHLHIYCLLNYDTSISKEIKNTINNALIEIQQYLLGFEQYEVTIGMGAEKDSVEGAYLSLHEAKNAVNNRIKMGTGRLIYYEDAFDQTDVVVLDYFKSVKETYVSSIRSFSTSMFKHCVKRIFDGTADLEIKNYSSFYDLANHMTDVFFDEIEVKKELNIQKKQHLLDAYQHCYTWEKLKDLLSEQLSAHLKDSYQTMKDNSTKPIRQAKQYINAHYNEKILLEDIAEIVGLNSVYFSVLFKKETDLNFSAYLIQVRINKAKEMLKNSNDTIAAIADKVGYKDVRYFSRLFTKTVGLKPALFRKLYS